jgi:hypothetical protein
MDEGRKNLIGDLVMSTTLGCLFVFSFMSIIGFMGLVFLYIISILKPFF